jgi:hypothetical protein
MKKSKALIETFVGGMLDFPNDKYPVTVHAGGSGKLVDCWKCEKCGYSIRYYEEEI